MSSKVNITFRAQDSGLFVRGLLGQGMPTLSGGYGGWETVARPHRVSLTNWIGRDPIRMALPILFDGFIQGNSIEANITQLTSMGQPGGDGEPPTIKVSGAIPRRDIKNWVIESLDWGTDVVWGFNQHGVAVRLRQDVMVNLLQYVAADRVQIGSQNLKIQPKGRPKPHHKFHIVKKGETMATISMQEYGDPKYVRDICKANKINDPKVITTKKWLNKRLRMP